MSNDTEKRLAALERGYKAEKEKADKLEAKLAETSRENKRLRAQSVDQARAAATGVNSMRELHAGPGGESPFESDPRAKYDALRRATLKDKSGLAYYFTDGPTYVGNRYYVGFRNSAKGNQADFIVTIPQDQDPSVQWEAVELGGVDPRTSIPVFRPLGSGEKMERELAAKREELASQFTNTEINERRAQQDRELGQRGARADAPPPPGGGPLDPKGLELGSPSGRPSDNAVG